MAKQTTRKQSTTEAAQRVQPKNEGWKPIPRFSAGQAVGLRLVGICKLPGCGGIAARHGGAIEGADAFSGYCSKAHKQSARGEQGPSKTVEVGAVMAAISSASGAGSRATFEDVSPRSALGHALAAAATLGAVKASGKSGYVIECDAKSARKVRAAAKSICEVKVTRKL